MDLAPEDLQFLSIRDILRESISIPKQSPKSFSLVTLTLIFPLSLAILAQSLFTKPLIHEFDCSLISVIDIYTNLVQLYQKWTLILFQLFYFIFLFAFSLLSTAAVVFTVASLYTSKPVSFSNTLSAIPKVLKRLLITFLWVSLLMVGYNFLFLGFWILILEADREILGFVFYLVLVVLFSVVHVYTTALWHLASVVSVLEPVYGFAAMKKSYELLKGDTARAYVLVFEYLATCGVIGGISRMVLVHGGDCFEVPVFVRIAVGGFLVGVLVIVNLVGLLLQSVFYFVCKSYHHQGIDKNALHDHLGGYLGDYVPLKSSIQMENMDVREGN